MSIFMFWKRGKRRKWKSVKKNICVRREGSAGRPSRGQDRSVLSTA
uniref:66B3 n=1 Tax=Toxoplasma gondii TaxID=5811 RepID=Q6GYB2_TOXGO|nr:66B3 [Toxoplasma gondii]